MGYVSRLREARAHALVSHFYCIPKEILNLHKALTRERDRCAYELIEGLDCRQYGNDQSDGEEDPEKHLQRDDGDFEAS